MPTILSTLESMRQNMAMAAAAAAHPDNPPHHPAQQQHNHTQSTTTTGLQASTTLDLTATATALSPLPLDDADSPNPEHLVLALGPLDQVQVRKYTPRIFCFPMADQQPPTVRFATASLRLAVQKVLCRWPFLAGRLRYVDGNKENNVVEVRYVYPPPDAVQARVFHAQILPDFEMEYGELSAAGMPPSMLDCVALCGREEDGLGLDDDEDDDWFPVWRVQANFVPGGLLLAVADAHPVVDGVAAGLVVEELARCLRVGEVAAECEVGERVGAATVDGQRNGGDDDDDHQQQRETTSSIPEFELPDPQLPTATAGAGGKPTARILTIRASTLASLKTAVMAEVRRTPQPPAAFVSTQDVLSALLWTAIIRARAPRLLPTDDQQPTPTTHFCTAVDARNKSAHPPIPPTYLSNAVMYAIAAEPISTTTTSTTTASTIATTHLATAALAIRASIAAVAVPPFITRRIAAWSPPALPDPTHLLAVLGSKLDLSHSGVFVTSWVGFGGDVGWCVPGVGGNGVSSGNGGGVGVGGVGGGDGGGDGVKAQWIRKPWGVGEGTAVVLPRRGGTSGAKGADWEVLVRLGEGDMEKFLEVVGERGMGLVERVVE
ncbi:hypothetical protein SLS55_009174 [Diplodia seriata]|uniref:Trichothecene 3-O-acetyltransferase-like N-terminal domain-containing protein n=1 Tax=Diplodia seriata TaxID=420778 RepID=A0ABR3C7Z8_9PEZI